MIVDGVGIGYVSDMVKKKIGGAYMVGYLNFYVTKIKICNLFGYQNF